MTPTSVSTEERLAGPAAPSEESGDGQTLSVTSEQLEGLWSELMPDTFAGRQGLNTFLEAVQTAATGSSQAELQFRPGGWQVTMLRGTVQSIVAGALIGGLLVALGATGIPAAVVTAVVPMLFDVERVQLTAGQEYVLAELVWRRAALDGTVTPDQLYAQLSPETRAALSRIDFEDFLDTCRRAGLADQDDRGQVVLRPSDKARFRITFR